MGRKARAFQKRARAEIQKLPEITLMYAIGPQNPTSLYGLGMYIAGDIPCGGSSDPLMASPAMLGLGCAPCGGSCGGLNGFDMDFASWTWRDWASAFGVAYLAYSVFSTSARGARTVRKSLRRKRA